MLFLNVARVFDFLISAGREFHRVAAALSNRLFPYVADRVLGTVTNTSVSERSDLVG